MSVHLETFLQIHAHTDTCIHAIQTKYRNVDNVCMYIYIWVNTYMIHTACFTYKQIQTCRSPDDQCEDPVKPG